MVKAEEHGSEVGKIMMRGIDSFCNDLMSLYYRDRTWPEMQKSRNRSSGNQVLFYYFLEVSVNDFRLGWY